MNIEVKEKFDTYSVQAKKKLLEIRQAIFDVAHDDAVGEVTETLKWGEPSYLVKNGSTIRIDWKIKKPNQISIFFNCKTSLVSTFREIYGDRLDTVGNRELVFLVSDALPMLEMKACLSMALRYHSIKHLPLLGA